MIRLREVAYTLLDEQTRKAWDDLERKQYFTTREGLGVRPLTPKEGERLRVLRTQVTGELMRRFVAGAWAVEGCRAGRIVHTELKAAWWAARPIHLDAWRETVERDGVKWLSLCVERSPPAEAAEAPAVRRRAERGPNPTTLLAVRACYIVNEIEGLPKGGAKGLAVRAVTMATKLDLPGAAALDPDGSTLWKVANEFIKGQADKLRVPTKGTSRSR